MLSVTWLQTVHLKTDPAQPYKGKLEKHSFLICINRKHAQSKLPKRVIEMIPRIQKTMFKTSSTVNEAMIKKIKK